MVFSIISLLAISALFYHFVGYPVLLYIISNVFGTKKTRPDNTDYTPGVSVIVPIYNEAEVIAEKIECLRESDYCGEIEIIVTSDGCDDGGDLIATEMDTRVIRNPERRGKIAALNDAVAAATHNIIILTDANAMPVPQAIRLLVSGFADEKVGGVLGEQVITSANDGSGATISGGESAYWKYETAIKRYEAKLGGALCADGSLYALRKELYSPPPSGILIMDDLYISLKILATGKKLIIEPGATAYEEASIGSDKEFRRKARILAGSITAFVLAGPRAWFASPFKMFSHKLLRWATPLFQIIAYIAAIIGAILGDPISIALAAAQSLFYAAAIAGWGLNRTKSPFILKAPYYFCLTNLAQLYGYWVLIRDLKKPAWEKLR